MNEFFAYLSLVFIVAGIVIFVWGFCNSVTEKANVGKPGHDGQYRIVQLENGTYRVQEYQEYHDGWGMLTDIGPDEFDTLAEAQKRMDELIERDNRHKGYRISREVSRS